MSNRIESQLFTDCEYFNLANPSTGERYTGFFMVHPSMNGYRHAYIASVRQMVRDANRSGERIDEVFVWDFDRSTFEDGYVLTLKPLEERIILRKERCGPPIKANTKGELSN